MADLELSIPVKTALSRTGVFAMWALWPLWALIAPLCILATVVAICIAPSIFPGQVTLALICSSLAVMILGALATALCEDNRLYLNRDGILFPMFLAPFLGFRRFRSWEELCDADLRAGDRSDNRNLFLGFRRGAIKLSTKLFSKSDLEQLLLAVELWGKNCARTPLLIDFQTDLQNTNKGIERVSYTQLWEDELSRRFTNTAFIPLEPNTTLADGKLKVIRQVAFGGLSAIYLARKQDKEFVVLKEAAIPSNADPQMRRKAEEHFAREAHLLMRLRHPNIASVLDHFVEAGRNYLTLEYVNGVDLRQYIKQHGTESETTIANWALQIAAVLDYLHQQEPAIIHRDLSPDNLMLRNDGSLVLIDFGAANEFVTNATGTLVGKQAYMAPEQLRGKASPQSDLYAFGCTLYYMLVGKDPTPLSVSQPNTVRDVSDNINYVVSALTDLEPSSRPAAGSLAVFLQQKLNLPEASASSMAGTPT